MQWLMRKLRRAFACSLGAWRLSRAVLLVLVAVVLYNECLSYIWCAAGWLRLEPKQLSNRFIRILLVADPQLIGYQNEPYGIGWIARLDSDNYLSKTFSLAYAKAAPDVVIYLGDLLDEGSTGTDAEFFKSAVRFYHIFRAAANALNIYIPGDNDIGGEGIDFYSAKKESRFNHYFPINSSAVKFKSPKFISFYKAFYFNGEWKKIIKSTSIHNASELRVLLTHVPMLNLNSFSVQQILSQILPHLIFSAHSHKGFLWKRRIGSQTVHRQLLFDFARNQPLQMQLADSYVYEVEVPTCSYRMGVPDMAYVSVLIERESDNNNQLISMRMAVFWLPGRYPQLKLYLICLIGTFAAVTLRLIYIRMISTLKDV